MNELRVLLVAPSIDNINAIPEIRAIAALHRIFPLNGHVSLRDVYDAAGDDHYDIIHFALHSNTEALRLNGDTLTPEDVAQVGRLAHAKLIVLNSCYSGRHASYAVMHGLDYAIFSNVEVRDDAAWKFPVTFYEFLADQIERTHQANYAKAFNDASTGDGNYGITSAYDRVGVLPLQQKLELLEMRLWIMIMLGALTWLTFGVWAGLQMLRG
jgi:hypothetical protein